MSILSLKNKRAVVTGAGSGIGQAIAEAMATHDAEVFILDVNAEAGQAVAQSIQSNGGIAHFMPCDVTNLAMVTDVFKQIHDNGRIDILVNNAGIAHVGAVTETTPDAFQHVFQINVHGVYHCLYACLPHMKMDGGGAIVNIASTVSTIAIPNRFAYTASKGAVLSMTHSVALDYIDDNIRCNAISPGRVHTPFVDQFIAKNYPGQEAEMFQKLSTDHPIGRMAQPSEIANLALFLCSDAASYCTGTNHHADGGYTRLRGH